MHGVYVCQKTKYTDYNAPDDSENHTDCDVAHHMDYNKYNSVCISVTAKKLFFFLPRLQIVAMFLWKWSEGLLKCFRDTLV